MRHSRHLIAFPFSRPPRLCRRHTHRERGGTEPQNNPPHGSTSHTGATRGTVTIERTEQVGISMVTMFPLDAGQNAPRGLKLHTIGKSPSFIILTN